MINKPQNPRTKHVGTVFKRASSLVQEEFPAPMLENETKSEFQGVGENRAPFPSLPKGHCFPGVTPPPSAPFLLKHLHLARERRAPALRVVHGPPPAPASPALCTAEQSFTLLINQKLARKKVGQVNKDRLFFFFFCTEANNISKNTLVLVFSGFRLILFIYLWQQVEGSSPAAAPSDDSPSSIPARCSQERRDEEERGESRKTSPRGLGRRQGTAGGCWGKAGCGEQPPAPSAPVCPRVHACDMIYYPSAARRRAAQPRWWGRGIKGGGPGCPEHCGAPTPSTPPARGPFATQSWGTGGAGGTAHTPGVGAAREPWGRVHTLAYTHPPRHVCSGARTGVYTHTHVCMCTLTDVLCTCRGIRTQLLHTCRRYACIGVRAGGQAHI